MPSILGVFLLKDRLNRKIWNVRAESSPYSHLLMPRGLRSKNFQVQMEEANSHRRVPPPAQNCRTSQTPSRLSIVAKFAALKYEGRLSMQPIFEVPNIPNVLNESLNYSPI